MKRTIKKNPALIESLTERETKGKSISIYLNAESLWYVDHLCKILSKGRSKVIQDIVIEQKKAFLYYVSRLGDDKSELAEALRKIASS